MNRSILIIGLLVIFSSGMFIGAHLKESTIRELPTIITETPPTVVIVSPPDTVWEEIRAKTITIRDTIMQDGGGRVVSETDTTINQTLTVSEKEFSFPYAVNIVKAIGKKPVLEFQSSLEINWEKVEHDMLLPKLEAHGRSKFKKGLIIGALTTAATAVLIVKAVK